MKALYASFLSLPHWVKIWMVLILVPANMMGMFFLDSSIGLWMAILGIGGMLPNILVMIVEKAFSKTMAVSHIIPWTALVIYLAVQLYQGNVPEGAIYYAVWSLLIIDIISLMFDYKESVEWFQERKQRLS